MSHIPIMNILQGQQQLLYDALGFLLTELSVRLILEVRVEAFARCVLHYEEDVAWRVDAFVKFNNIGVI